MKSQELVELLKSNGLQIELRQLQNLAVAGHFKKANRGDWDKDNVIIGLAIYYRGRYDSRQKGEGRTEKQIKTEREIELLEIKIAEKGRKLVSVDSVQRSWHWYCEQAKARIMSCNITAKEKDEILKSFVEIPVEQYFEDDKTQSPQ